MPRSVANRSPSRRATRGHARRVGETRRADLDRLRTGDHQLDRIPTRRDSPDTDDRQLRVVPGARRGRPGPRPGGSARPDRSTAAVAERRAAASSRSNASPSSVLISVTASAPASRSRHRRPRRCGRCWRSASPTAAGRSRRSPRSPRPTASASCAKMLATTLEIRARQVDLDRDDLGGGVGEQLGGPAIVVDRTSPDAAHDRRTGREQRRQSWAQPVLDRPAPGGRPR